MNAPGGQGPLHLAHGDTFPSDWDDLLAADGNADYSHTRHWTEAACRHYRGAGPVVLTVRRGEALVGGLCAVARRGPARAPRALAVLRRWDSSLEGTSGGPLVPSTLPPQQAREIFLMLTDAFAGLRQGVLSSAAMALNPGHEARGAGWLQGRAPWRRQDSPTAMISLQGGIEVVAAERLGRNKRNERNRSLNRGAEVSVVRNPDVLAEYYPLYLRAARLWGVAPTPLGFLQDLLAGPPGGGPGGAYFTCVRLDGRLIGGHLNVHLCGLQPGKAPESTVHGGTVPGGTVPGGKVQAWNGVTDPAFARTHFPATLACWGDLVEACRLGASWLDLGASGPHATLESFKRSFGAELQPRGYYVADSAALSGLRRARSWRPATRRHTGADPATDARARPRWHDRGDDP